MYNTLNIQQHICNLTVQALNQASTIDAAANLLGVTNRTVYRYIKQFNINYCPVLKQYSIQNQNK